MGNGSHTPHESWGCQTLQAIEPDCPLVRDVTVPPSRRYVDAVMIVDKEPSAGWGCLRPYVGHREVLCELCSSPPSEADLLRYVSKETWMAARWLDPPRRADGDPESAVSDAEAENEGLDEGLDEEEPIDGRRLARPPIMLIFSVGHPRSGLARFSAFHRDSLPAVGEDGAYVPQVGCHTMEVGRGLLLIIVNVSELKGEANAALRFITKIDSITAEHIDELSSSDLPVDIKLAIMENAMQRTDTDTHVKEYSLAVAERNAWERFQRECKDEIEAIEQGREELEQGREELEQRREELERPRQALYHLFERRLARPLSEDEAQTLSARLTTLGPERLGDVVLDVTDGQELSAWLADPEAS